MKTTLALVLSLFFAAPVFAAESPVRVAAAFAKPSLAGVTTGVAFLTLTSPVDDTLVSAASDAARVTEIHDHLLENGVMQMRKVDRVALPAGKPVAMKSGGLHLMLFDMKRVLKEGDVLPLTLTFEKSAPLTLDVPVRAQASEASPTHEHHMH